MGRTVTIYHHRDHLEGAEMITAKFDSLDLIMGEYLAQDVLRQISKQIAERYVAEHYQEIAAKMDQQALATLSVAEGASKIRETPEKKIPDKVLEIIKDNPAVYQRGFFGGMTRIR